MAWKTEEGSTGRLVQLCLGYFVCYVLTGFTVKYFLGKPQWGLPGMKGLQFLVYSTAGGTLVCLPVVLVLRWYRLQSQHLIEFAGRSIPRELFYIIPSGICTAVVIPTTTLMYTLPISVMVAMVMMRGSVIVVSRLIDSIQNKQGILDKQVYREENVAVGFALLAVAVHIFSATSAGRSVISAVFGAEYAPKAGGFAFLQDPVAMSILGSYVTAYAIRIYIMNYFKNTRAKGAKSNNKGFFAVEQIASSVTLFLLAAVLFVQYTPSGSGERLTLFHNAIASPEPLWLPAIFAGGIFGVAAFFSVFIFMFKGRTATFAGLVNRLTSLIAGTTSTLLFAFFYSGRYPKPQDWASLVFILVAVGFLSVAERKRAAELAS